MAYTNAQWLAPENLLQLSNNFIYFQRVMAVTAKTTQTYRRTAGTAQSTAKPLGELFMTSSSRGPGRIKAIAVRELRVGA